MRSPLAENLFSHLAEQQGVAHKYQVDSAGTSSWHIGESPDTRMRRVAARHGLSYSGRARQFQDSDLDRFDLILAMDRNNFAELLRQARSATNNVRRSACCESSIPWADREPRCQTHITMVWMVLKKPTRWLSEAAGAYWMLLRQVNCDHSCCRYNFSFRKRFR